MIPITDLKVSELGLLATVRLDNLDKEFEVFKIPGCHELLNLSTVKNEQQFLGIQIVELDDFKQSLEMRL